MDRETEAFILDILRRHDVLTLATVRKDGFPQATTVGYVNRMRQRRTGNRPCQK